jgi:hypothetical protein
MEIMPPRKSQKSEPKPEPKKMDLYFYRSDRNSLQVYVTGACPEYNHEKGRIGANASGFNVDICQLGLAAFGLGPADFKPWSKIVKISIAILSMEGSAVKVTAEFDPFKPLIPLGPGAATLQRMAAAKEHKEERDEEDTDEPDEEEEDY